MHSVDEGGPRLARLLAQPRNVTPMQSRSQPLPQPGNYALRTDADLVRRSMHGDEPAFSALMSRHRAWALRFIRRYVGNSEDANDLLQETFLAAWRALDRYECDRPFDVWLRRIALNKCRDQSRREAVRRVVNGCLSGIDVPDVADSAPGPSTRIEGEQELVRLVRNMQGLSRSLTRPLMLTAVDGLSQGEAGEMLGISAKAVETRVYRARLRLMQLCRDDRLQMA